MLFLPLIDDPAILPEVPVDVIPHGSMKKRLTVIDDDNDLRHLLQIALKSEGYDVNSYASGQEFLDDLKNHAPSDVYIIDINLGGITGYEVCKQLKNENGIKDKHVILISANPEVQQLSQDACANDYMLKPISLKLLFQKVKDLI